MASEQEHRPLNLMPVPASAESGTGQLAVDASFSVALTGHDDARLERAVQRFLRQLGRQTGHLAIPTNAENDRSLRERSRWMKTTGKIRPNQSYYKLHEIQALGEH